MSLEVQKSEIGDFPASWDVDRVDSAFDIQQGKQVSKKNRDGEHQRPFLRTKNVFWNRLDLADLDHMHFSAAEQARLELRADDLLVCEGGSIGRTALWDNEVDGCLYQNHLHRLRAKGTKADPQFAVYWFWYAFDVAKLYFGRGNVTTIPNLSQSKLAELPMALPPLSEQKKIAHILSTVQRAIKAQERIIQTTTELKKALMHKLFTEGLRNEPLKQSEIGPVPESWEVVPVGNICRSIVPGRNKPKIFDGDIPWLTTPNIKGLDYINADVDGLRVSSDELRSSGGRLIPEKSVIMSCVGEFGVSAVTNIEIVINQQLHAFICPAKLNPVFLCNQLRYRKPYMQSIAAITTIPYLNKSKCESVPIALPGREEQDEVAVIFDTLDSKRNQHIAHRHALQDLFRTLLHELMTAKTRVQDVKLEI
ncbi:restriction endonuclease subunit S [Thiorhodovibrio frisius]|uniref:Restriction endonuclease S subunit n=1 Tax=Thiorhodovibrio frisius TaxID=631362 RepID=H8Z0Z4_9GAMM|nr:restriction endonuclease subunit S [Thiorhodovibrio frisius]EIC22415.1 restriction endonuclease S subunit [Thiorhodovibrio frisius]WPL24714.1 EcoKI restriction-modification system protein HsdS [Thiorhodovibrio frisius]